MPGAQDRLDEENVAADRCPCEPRSDARDAGAHGDFVLKSRLAEDILQVPSLDVDLFVGRLRDPYRVMPENLANFPFEGAHARLAGVVMDDLPQRVIVNSSLFRGQSVRFQLAGHEITPRDLQLLLRRVAGQRDDLHTVAQRPGDRVEQVRGRDEGDARQIERHAEIIVAEGRILLWIKHFQHRRGRVALEAAAILSISEMDKRDRGFQGDPCAAMREEKIQSRIRPSATIISACLSISRASPSSRPRTCSTRSQGGSDQ